jgi:hypothetical protein
VFATAILSVGGETATLSCSLVARQGVSRCAVDSNSANPCRGNLVDRRRLSKSGLAGALDVERLPCLVRRFLKDHGTHSCVVAGLGDNQGSDERV